MLEVLMGMITQDVGEHPTVITSDRPAPEPRPSLVGDPVSRPVAEVAEVAEVAAGVIAAMRRVNEAHERHVEALEIETARRCELVTSQADLDAELIRLHARREAHAIVFAARARTGGAVTDDQRADDELHEIGEVVSRFAESVDRDLPRDL
jgi:hypothetical protein